MKTKRNTLRPKDEAPLEDLIKQQGTKQPKTRRQRKLSIYDDLDEMDDFNPEMDFKGMEDSLFYDEEYS